MFGNLYGGLASITVRGSLQRPSGTEVASYSLTRRIHVIGPTGAGSSIGQHPLLILGSGSNLDKANQDFVSASSPSVSVNSAPQVNIGCLLGAASSCLNPIPSVTGVDDLSAVTLPAFPTPASLGDPTSRDPNDATLVTATITQANNNTYPYSTAVPGNINGVTAALRPECKLNSASTAINCLVNTISTSANNAQIRIDTSYYPVNIFVRGAISFQRGSVLGAKNVINGTAPSDWSRLRIYGNNSGSSCVAQSAANSFSQSISVGGSAAFTGAFSWFPKARIFYGTGGGGGSSVSNFGAMWICRFQGPGSENQAWGAPLDISTGFGNIFGAAFGGPNDALIPLAIPSSPSFYRSYGAS